MNNNNGRLNFLDNTIYAAADDSDLFSTSGGGGVQQQSPFGGQQTPPQPPQFSQRITLPVNNNNGQFNFLNNSIYTIYDDEASFSTNEAQGQQQSQSSGQQTPPQVQQQFPHHYTDRSDLLIKLSRIIFEDFHNLILPLNSKNDVELNEKKEEKFLDVIQKFLEICEHSVQGIRKICVENLDPHSKIMLGQLILERAAYNLVLRIQNSNKLLNDNENLVSTSFLTKLFRENVEFRRISTLLLWNEDCSMFAPTEFSAIAETDIVKLSEHDDIYACTKIRGPIHVDSRFVDRIAAEDEEAVQTLNRVLFALLRSGRLQDAKTLLENVGLPSMSSFIIIREFLVNQKLSPLERFDEQFNLAQSRMHFKQTARELIPSDDERIQQADQCIWACLGGHLPTLLSYAQCTEDRFWALLSCAAEAMLDKSLSEFHSKADEQINLLAMDMEKETEDLPQTVQAVFQQLRINEESPFYAIFEHLTLEQWEQAAKFIDQYLEEKGQAPAHQLRFFIHILLLLKLTGQWKGDVKIMDNLIEIYANLLEEMKLNGIIPLYLFHLSAGKAVPKMLDFLESLIFEPEQKEVLQSALNAGFDVAELCRSIFKRFKAKYTIDGRKSEQEMSKSAAELLRAWKWLIYCGPETIWNAIIEANYLMRKLFLHNRMEEATALLKMIPENLGFAALDAFGGEFPDIQIPSNLLDAKHEFECYRFYFEALDRYEEWQRQMEGSQAPEIPAKLSDERWARMDIRRRTEYELNVKRAQECLNKYYRLVELCKKRAVEMLESILKMPDGWLVKQTSDEDSMEPGVFERINDFGEIRKHYLAHLLELLVDIQTNSKEPFEVMQIASLLMDPKYNLYKALDKDKLQKLLTKISKSGAALLL